MLTKDRKVEHQAHQFAGNEGEMLCNENAVGTRSGSFDDIAEGKVSVQQIIDEEHARSTTLKGTKITISRNKINTPH